MPVVARMSQPKKHTRVTRTALILAAGTGARLMPLTSNTHKCLTEVSGIPILERLVVDLVDRGFEKLVVVLGHLGEQIQKFLAPYSSRLQIEYVTNPIYRTTNNIYSLWLARSLISEPFVLIECDLVFEPQLFDQMCEPDRMAISHLLPWMNGTMVELDANQRVSKICVNPRDQGTQPRYKTVNINSFSLETWSKVAKRLSEYVCQGRVNEYYEVVFAELVDEGAISLDVGFFDTDKWHEIDTLKDLEAAEKLFPAAPGYFVSEIAAQVGPFLPKNRYGVS